MLLPSRREHTSVQADADVRMRLAQTSLALDGRLRALEEGVSLLMELCLALSVLQFALCTEEASEAIGRKGYRITARSMPECHRYSEACCPVLLCPYAFLVGREEPVGENSPRAGERIRESESSEIAWRRIRVQSFSSPLVQALAPRPVRGPKTSATLGKPLSREFLFYRYSQHLSTPLGSGLCVTREPRLPRIQESEPAK